MTTGVKPKLIEFRLLSKIKKTETCWLWEGQKNVNGYGKIGIGSRTDKTNRMVYAHRLSYEIYVGPIPEYLTINHICKVRNCVNPSHLEAITLIENLKKADLGKNTGLKQRSKTHCPSSHEYDKRNVRIARDGSRKCKPCQTKRSREWYQKKRMELILRPMQEEITG